METENNVFNIRIECFRCDSVFLVPVTTKEYKQWQDGMNIQDAMPTLSKENRELLISHMCGTCYANLDTSFGTEEITWPMEDTYWWSKNFH